MISATRRYDIRSFEVTQAYQEIACNLARAVYIRPLRELADPATHLLRLRKAFYGFSYSEAYWHETLTQVLQSDIRLQPATRDPAMYLGTSGGDGPKTGIVVT